MSWMGPFNFYRMWSLQGTPNVASTAARRLAENHFISGLEPARSTIRTLSFHPVLLLLKKRPKVFLSVHQAATGKRGI